MKKLLSLIMSVCMIFTILPVSAVAYAQDNSAQVNLSVYAGGAYALAPTETTVSADLSDKYADALGVNDTIDEPSLLDALIATAISLYGDTAIDDGALTVNTDGSISDAFYLGYAMSYRLNGSTTNSYSELFTTPVTDGDYVDYQFYQDTSYWSDKYVQFDSREITVNANEKFTLTASAEGYDDNWNTVLSAFSAHDVKAYAIADSPDNAVTVATTDDNGAATVSFSSTGTYAVTIAPADDTEYIFAPYCKVTVVDNPLAAAVGAKAAKGAQYCLNLGTNSFTLSNAVDYLTYLNSGYDMSAYKDAFLASVDEQITANGTLVTDDTASNALAIYGAVIGALKALGLDPTSYNGVNLVEQFESYPADAVTNPYYYRVAIENAQSEEFALKLCDKFIEKYYTTGKGMNYYGYSADNTAVFLTAIAKYKDNYADVVSDAVTVLETYANDDGFYYSADYSTSTNADSTALALMAYSALGELDKAVNCFNNLVKGFEDKNGAMLAANYSTGVLEDSAYATKEATLAFEYFKDIANSHVFKLTSSDVKACTGGTESYTCTDCNKTVSIAYAASADHTYKLTSEKAATCVADGYKEYTCEVCGNVNKVIEKATGKHTYAAVVTPATKSADGTSVKVCTVCGTKGESTVISKVKSVSLSYTKHAYTGKSLKPSVTVKDAQGNVIDAQYYTVSYKNNKKIGTATVTVTLKGNYSGKLTKTFKINPKPTSLKKLTGKKKSITVKWKQQQAPFTGYQVQYSTSKKFTAKTTKSFKIGKKKITSKTVKKLKANKKYYVRVRTYKIVNGKTYYSTWSKVKTVKTK